MPRGIPRITQIIRNAGLGVGSPPESFTPVSSSNIKGVDFVENLLEHPLGDIGTLYIQFNYANAVYAYYDVPASVFDALMSAASKGTYLNDNIKPNYVAERVR